MQPTPCSNDSKKTMVQQVQQSVLKREGSLRSANSTPREKRRVQWSDEVSTKVIEEWESESEDSGCVSPGADFENESHSVAETVAPSRLHSTRFAALRPLKVHPHPHFRSEELQNRPIQYPRPAVEVRPVMILGTETIGTGQMASTRYSVAFADQSSSMSLTSVPLPAAAAAYSSGRRAPPPAALELTPARRDEKRRYSSSSSSSSTYSLPHEMALSSPPSSPSPLATAAPHSPSAAAAASPTRFAVSGVIAGSSKLEAGLEGVLQLINKMRSCQLKKMHIQTADPILAEVITNLHSHMTSEFGKFEWPHLLTERAKELGRLISVATIVVDITIEHVPEKEGIFRRVSHRIKSVFSFFRRFA